MMETPNDHRNQTDPPGLMGWLGLRRMADWDFSRARPLGVFVGFLLMLVMLILVVTFFATLFSFAGTVTGLGTLSENFDMRAAGVLLAFLLGAPFVIWRTHAVARQAETAAESLFNEKINAASEGLAARRQVTRAIGVDDEEKVFTEWADDLVTRNAAIDRLEGLVHERPAAADRVASLLSVYVSELSQEHVHRRRPVPDDTAPSKMGDWARRIKRGRSDMEKAAQTLGRLPQIVGVQLKKGRINLQRANLQACDLAGLDFKNTPLKRAHLEGAVLTDAHLEGADLVGAGLEGADLTGAHLEEADLTGAYLQGAVLTGAHLEGANLAWARLEGVNLIGAHLDEKTALENANLRGAFSREVDWSNVKIARHQVELIFGDASVKLPDPDPIAHPRFWPHTKLDQQQFDHELEKWRADPASYTPPKDRA